MIPFPILAECMLEELISIGFINELNEQDLNTINGLENWETPDWIKDEKKQRNKED